MDSDDVAPSPLDEEVILVPLWSTDDGLPTTSWGTPVDLAAEHPPASATVAELAGSAITLSAPIDATPEAVAMLSTVPVPECFDVSGWLREHRALVLTDGRCELEGLTVGYDPQLGLYIYDDIDVDG